MIVALPTLDSICIASSLLARRLGLGLLACVVSAFGEAAAVPEDAQATEYQLKAAFLKNFVAFTTWPEECFERARSPFVVGVVGKDPFGKVVDLIFEGQKVGQHAVEVRRFERGSDVENCHLLFVPSAQTRNLKTIQRAISGQSVLVVGESKHFARKGGVVGFVIEDTKLRFEVNPSAAKRAKLRISSKLLRLARIVEDETWLDGGEL